LARLTDALHRFRRAALELTTRRSQRGPLYLPEPEDQTERTETVSDAEESAEDDSEESEETPR